MRRCLATVVGVICLGSTLQGLANHESLSVTRVVAGWPIAAFTLTDLRGRTFTQEQLQGRWTFVLFGDTRCGEPCTATLAALSSMCRRIAGTEALKTTQVLFLSFDPERDTPAQLRQYLAPFDERFIGASGSWPTLQRLGDDLGVADRLPPGPGPVNAGGAGYRGTLMLIGPDGIVRAEFIPPFEVLRLTAEYLKTRSRR